MRLSVIAVEHAPAHLDSSGAGKGGARRNAAFECRRRRDNLKHRADAVGGNRAVQKRGIRILQRRLQIIRRKIRQADHCANFPARHLRNDDGALFQVFFRRTLRQRLNFGIQREHDALFVFAGGIDHLFVFSRQNPVNRIHSVVDRDLARIAGQKFLIRLLHPGHARAASIQIADHIGGDLSARTIAAVGFKGVDPLR